MIHPMTLLTIVLMASTTYLTRIAGYLVLRNRALSSRAVVVMEAAPGCVLISVIAPSFVSNEPADIIALIITLVAATRLPMLATVTVGVVAAGMLRHILS
jgi:uncharacterized membrane protein